MSEGNNTGFGMDEDGDVRLLGLHSRNRRHLTKRRRRNLLYCSVCAMLFALVAAVLFATILGIGLSARRLVDRQCTENRFDCYPDAANESIPTQKECEDRGCCWNSGGDARPKCYYPYDYGYFVDGSVAETAYGYSANLSVQSAQKGEQHWYGKDLSSLRIDVYYETEHRVHVKIYDPKNSRYEVPIPVPTVTTKASSVSYSVEIFKTDVFSFSVSRTSPTKDLFVMGPGFVFSDQFLQLSAYLSNSKQIYGLGEHTTRLALDTSWTKLTLWARDTPPDPNNPGQNLYGVHPFYMGIEGDGSAHGVFLLNSNAMEIGLQPDPSISYRTIGGVLDFYFFLGPTPQNVIQQYTELIGHPFMPPYWSLGFHLCRWGYGSANKTLEVVQRMRDAGIPQDTQWNDIDYMDNELDFTYNKLNFSDLPQLVENIHNNSQKYIVITDPGISNTQPSGTYPPYDDGVTQDIFIKNSSGKILVGQVWPGLVAFPDFTHPKIYGYWENEIRKFHQTVKFDGLWIDMNEPSNFVMGSVSGCPSDPDVPFKPGQIRDLQYGLIEKTLCMSAQQSVSTHYNVHSLYGMTEAKATLGALTSILQQRSLVISRSTYPGSGVHGGHWLGDNASQWPHMAISISGILQFALFGIPMVGADICGFFDNTTEELCTRWQQLGAFYPFSRNHNSIGNTDQDPAVFSNASIASTRSVLLIRYSLLPYLYTLFLEAHTNGTAVTQPLFFEYPRDSETWAIDTQFMWGSGLLISPVLTQGATSVNAYFPKDRWYAFRDGMELSEETPGHVDLDAPLDFIPLHLRGGTIVPTQLPNTTTVESRKNPFSLLIALDDNEMAEGRLFLDDGESLLTYENKKYTLLTFIVSNSLFEGIIEESDYAGASSLVIETVRIMGLSDKPSDFRVNGTSLSPDKIVWNPSTKVLDVKVDIMNLNKPFDMTWTK